LTSLPAILKKYSVTPIVTPSIGLNNSLDINSNCQYDHHILAVFLVVTKNHVSPGIIRGFFLFKNRKKVLIEL
jgi:hypothetical protein